jgi:LEA14-like dessication related protein
MRTKLLVLTSIILLTYTGCKTIRELTAFAKCQFRHTTIQGITLAGVDVQKIKNYRELNLVDAGKVTANIVKGRLPLSFVINVQIKNPGTNLAAVNKLEWIALINDVEISKGNLSKRLEIAANGGTATLPVAISSDLVKILGKDNREKLWDFAFGLSNDNNEPSRKVTLKVKPTIMIGKASFTYPGYIKLNHDFSAE